MGFFSLTAHTRAPGERSGAMQFRIASRAQEAFIARPVIPAMKRPNKAYDAAFRTQKANANHHHVGIQISDWKEPTGEMVMSSA